MNFEWADVIVPALVAVIAVPAVQYLFGRRGAQAQGAFEARRAFYDVLLTNLTRYVEYVKWLPPNMSSNPNRPDGSDVAIPTEIEMAMRLHASPVLRVRVNELLEALDEAKWQSDLMLRERDRADGLPKDTFEKEWAHDRAHQHARRKSRADKWAAECLDRIKHRMRYELYGWRRGTPFIKVLARSSANRVRDGRTDPLMGAGGVPWEPPPGRREEWEASRRERGLPIVPDKSQGGAGTV